jgi:pimeloyl-ACP methyl ester carboxylesterase
MAERWVLLHGAPLNPAVWDGVRGQLSVDTVAPDLARAMPRSSVANVLQRDIAASLLAADKSDDNLVLIGHSVGGQVALEMALIAPQRIRRLVLVATRDTPIPEFRQTADALRRGHPLDIEAGIRRWFTPAEIADNGPVVRYSRRQLESTPMRHYASVLEAIATYDRSAQAGSIAVPAVLLCGRLDRSCPPTAMRRLAADLPSAKLHIVDDWAHMSPFVEPADLAARLIAAVAEPVPRAQ